MPEEPTTPALLRLDLPDWEMPQPDRADGVGSDPVPRRLRIWELPDGTYIAVITERGEGRSVSNVAELAYAAVVFDCFGDVGRSRVHVFEHYPPTPGFPETFEEITVEPRPPHRPSWRDVPVDEMVRLCGPDVLDVPDEPPAPSADASAA
jgi:hypothetical protein